MTRVIKLSISILIAICGILIISPVKSEAKASDFTVVEGIVDEHITIMYHDNTVTVGTNYSAGATAFGSDIPTVKIAGREEQTFESQDKIIISPNI